MSQKLKLLVLAFLQNLPESPFDQFNNAFELYKQCPNKNRAAETSYNRRGYNEQSLKNLLYDLQKLNNITDVEVHDKQIVAKEKEENPFFSRLIDAFLKLDETSRELILKTALVVQKFSDFIESSEELKQVVENGTAEFEKFKADNPELVLEDGALRLADLFDAFVYVDATFFDVLISELEIELKTVNETSEDKKVKFLNEISEKLISVSDSDLDKGIIKNDFKAIREEFPFLNEEGCPDIMYVVVGRRIAVFRKYCALHARLQEHNLNILKLEDEELKNLTIDCEAAFSENRALWDELEHYAKTKEILGKHPMFREDMIKKEVEKMTQEQLVKFTSSSVKYFHDQKKALEKHKDNPEEIAKINSKIADRQYKLALVNSKLGVNAGEKK
jgi:hypothetical protein